jgi:hypothetical protein
MESNDYRDKISKIRVSFMNGNITLEEAKDRVSPLLLEMNKIGAVIAKQFNKKYKKLTFSYVFR